MWSPVQRGTEHGVKVPTLMLNWVQAHFSGLSRCLNKLKTQSQSNIETAETLPCRYYIVRYGRAKADWQSLQGSSGLSVLLPADLPKGLLGSKEVKAGLFHVHL